jgi:hypothetical protein
VLHFSAGQASVLGQSWEALDAEHLAESWAMQAAVGQRSCLHPLIHREKPLRAAEA